MRGGESAQGNGDRSAASPGRNCAASSPAPNIGGSAGSTAGSSGATVAGVNSTSGAASNPRPSPGLANWSVESLSDAPSAGASTATDRSTATGGTAARGGSGATGDAAGEASMPADRPGPQPACRRMSRPRQSREPLRARCRPFPRLRLVAAPGQSGVVRDWPASARPKSPEAAIPRPRCGAARAAPSGEDRAEQQQGGGAIDKDTTIHCSSVTSSIQAPRIPLCGACVISAIVRRHQASLENPLRSDCAASVPAG